MASARGMTPPVPFRVGATVACELTALHDNSELEVTPEDAGAQTQTQTQTERQPQPHTDRDTDTDTDMS